MSKINFINNLPIESNKKDSRYININAKKSNENNNLLLNREYLYDMNFFNLNNMNTNKSMNKLEYKLIMLSHTLEKGMAHFKLRPFASKKVSYITNILRYIIKYENYENKFSFINGINILREYKRIYEVKNWTTKYEYLRIKLFLKNFTKIRNKKVGSYILTNEQLKRDYNFDYLKFIKSRHSTRNYKNNTIKLEDIKAAVEMAKYSPSACNKQNIRLHFYPSGKMRDNVIKYSLGKGGLYLNGVNTFILTFDVNGLSGVGQRNQGYFNAGLFSMNLINAFHSLGIGTCFIQFSNSVKEEEKLKKLNDIPRNERIAVIIFAGYYDEKSIFTVSQRKDVNDLFFEHK